MRILTRYVLTEFLFPLFYCLTGFLSLYVLFELFGSFSRLIDAEIGAGDVLRYFCGYLAPYFHYIAPAALMLATLYTMWTFCRHSEIIAMRASGITFLTIVKPLLAVALLMGAFVAWINECYVPHNSHWAAQMKTEKFDIDKLKKADNLVFRNAKAGRTWNIDSILDDHAEHLSGVRVTMDRPGGHRLMKVTAGKADYLDGEWWLAEVHVQHYDALGVEVATTTPELESLPMRCFSEFNERPGDFIMLNRPWKYNSVRDRLRYLRTHPDLTQEARAGYVYDVWSQIMSPFACLLITLFAIPAGIASGRQSVSRGILGALVLYFAFYGVTIGCTVVAKNGWVNPVVAAVLPAAIYLILGIRALIRQR